MNSQKKLNLKKKLRKTVKKVKILNKRGGNPPYANSNNNLHNGNSNGYVEIIPENTNHTNPSNVNLQQRNNGYLLVGQNAKENNAGNQEAQQFEREIRELEKEKRRQEVRRKAEIMRRYHLVINNMRTKKQPKLALVAKQITTAETKRRKDNKEELNKENNIGLSQIEIITKGKPIEINMNEDNKKTMNYLSSSVLFDLLKYLRETLQIKIKKNETKEFKDEEIIDLESTTLMYPKETDNFFNIGPCALKNYEKFKNISFYDENQPDELLDIGKLFGIIQFGVHPHLPNKSTSFYYFIIIKSKKDKKLKAYYNLKAKCLK